MSNVRPEIKKKKKEAGSERGYSLREYSEEIKDAQDQSKA